MPYEKKVSRALPALIVLLLDDSGSMADNLPGTTDAKYLWVERYFGIILKELLKRSTEPKGDTVVVKPRYYFLVNSYGSAQVIWGGGLMNVEEAARKYTDSGNSLGLGGRLGGTDAEAAHQMLLDSLTKVIGTGQFKDSFPPMLFHLTDGMSQTDAQPVVDRIKQLTTTDGNVIVVNAYIGTQTSLNYRGPDDFPGYLTVTEAGTDPDNIRMFNMSSEAPETIQRNLVDDGIFPNLRAGARLFFDVRTKDMLKHVIQVVGSLGSRADRAQR